MIANRLHVTAERPLDAPLLTFDIPSLLEQMKAEEPWRREGHNAITLVKSKQLRVVLVTLRQGTAMKPHRADGPLSVQVVEGAVTFRTNGQGLHLTVGQLLTLQGGQPHSIEAPQESAFLLTLSAQTRHPAGRAAG